MTSLINPNDIDGAYPVAGQDNDSQGFRDNFTNIKQNFDYAASEITDLQNNAILKSALIGSTLNNNMLGSLLYNFQAQQVTETVLEIGNVAIGNTATLDFAASSFYKITPLGDCSIAFANLPSLGKAGRIRLQIDTNSNVYSTISFPSAVNIGTNNVQGFSNNSLTFNQLGVFEYDIEFANGPSGNIALIDLNRNRDPIYLVSEEDVAPAANLSLDTSVSTFDTSGAETSTLNAGVQGQIKILTMTGDSGDMVVTVTRAGWNSGSAGTITFTAVGQSAILIFLGAAWYCISTGPDASNGYPLVG